MRTRAARRRSPPVPPVPVPLAPGTACPRYRPSRYRAPRSHPASTARLPYRPLRYRPSRWRSLRYRPRRYRSRRHRPSRYRLSPVPPVPGTARAGTARPGTACPRYRPLRYRPSRCRSLQYRLPGTARSYIARPSRYRPVSEPPVPVTARCCRRRVPPTCGFRPALPAVRSAKRSGRQHGGDGGASRRGGAAAGLVGAARGAARAPLHAARGRVPLPGRGRPQPLGHPQGALHRDRLARLHGGGGGLRQRHAGLRAAAGRHGAARVPRRLRLHLPGPLLRHGPRRRRAPGAVPLRRPLPRPPPARLPRLLPDQQGPPVRFLLHVLRLLPHPLHLRPAALQRHRGHGHPLPRRQPLPGGALVLGLPHLQPGRVGEDEHLALRTRTSLPPPPPFWSLGLHPQALHLCPTPGSSGAALPAGEPRGLPQPLLRPGPPVPVQVDSELALPAGRGFPASRLPRRAAPGSPGWPGALCPAPVAQVQREHPVPAKGSCPTKTPVPSLVRQQDRLRALLLQLPGRLLQPLAALPVLRVVLPHAALPAVVHADRQAGPHAQGAAAGCDRALLEHVPVHGVQLPLPARVPRPRPAPTLAGHGRAAGPARRAACQEARAAPQEGAVSRTAGTGRSRCPSCAAFPHVAPRLPSAFPERLRAPELLEGGSVRERPEGQDLCNKGGCACPALATVSSCCGWATFIRV